MTESTPPEGGSLTFVQTQQLHRSLTEKVLDRAQSDPEWKQILIEDPELAMREADFPEVRELGQAQPLGQGPRQPREREVVGQDWDDRRRRRYGYGYGYGRRCGGSWSLFGWFRSY